MGGSEEECALFIFLFIIKKVVNPKAFDCNRGSPPHSSIPPSAIYGNLNLNYSI